MEKREPESDRRHFNLVTFHSSAILSQANTQADVEIIDLSLNGVLLNSFNYEGFDLSKPLQLALPLADNAIIEMVVQCIHQSELKNGDTTQQKCGFRCDTIDVDSITHLRRLVELNLGSSDALDRDLTELLNTD